MIMSCTSVYVVNAKTNDCLDGQPCRSFGSLKLENKTISSLKSSGSTCLKDVVIQGSAAVSGSSDFQNVSVAGSVKNSGQTRFENVVVQDSLKCSGSLKAKGGSLGELIASGSVSLVDLVIYGHTRVSGALKAKNTKFEGIESSACKSSFTDCSIQSIHMDVRNTECGWMLGDTVKPTIELVDTTVQGDIIFEGKKGEVILVNDAVVEGKIVNASITREYRLN